jgi:hypothetical protein
MKYRVPGERISETKKMSWFDIISLVGMAVNSVIIPLATFFGWKKKDKIKKESEMKAITAEIQSKFTAKLNALIKLSFNDLPLHGAVIAHCILESHWMESPKHIKTNNLFSIMQVKSQDLWDYISWDECLGHYRRLLKKNYPQAWHATKPSEFFWGLQKGRPWSPGGAGIRRWCASESDQVYVDKLMGIYDSFDLGRFDG